jgi:hypothetical protein
MSMRYTQSRARSAEVLGAALRHIGQHEACCDPITFVVWYGYAAGTKAGAEPGHRHVHARWYKRSTIRP